MNSLYQRFAGCAHAFLVAIAPLTTCGAAWAQGLDASCGSLENAYGPYDYRTDRGNRLYLVESAHFTPVVESLISGLSGPLGAELDYTLRAFPNHHRALISVRRYGQKTKLPQPPNLRYTVECYFARALQFRPDDTTVRMLYAGYLYQNNRPDEAATQLERTSFDAKESGFTQYNIGLVHLEAQQYDKALVQAHRAIALGFTRPDLKDRLVAVGRWREPEVPAPPEAAASGPVPLPVDAPGSAPSGR